MTHVFAQRALPLLAESEAPSPASGKRNGKTSRPSGEYFWQLYEALPHGQKMLMRLKALIDPAINKTALFHAVRAAGLRSPDGKAYASASFNEQLQALQRKGLLDDGFHCVPEIMHAVAVEAGRCEGAAALIEAAKTVIPKSERERVGRPAYYYVPPISQDENIFRHFRIC